MKLTAECRCLPEEVLTTEESTVAREALVSERTATLAALDTLGVPDAVENVQQEPVKDGTVTAGTQQQHLRAARAAGVRARVTVGTGRGRGGRLHATRLHSATDQSVSQLSCSIHTRANREQQRNNETTYSSHLSVISMLQPR